MAYYFNVAADPFVEAISLDTQVFVATGYNFSSKSFESLKSHFASGRLNLVMTDITVREVHSRIRQSVKEELISQRSFINDARVLFNSSLPEVQTSVTKLDPEVVAKDLCDQFDRFLKDSKATIIDTKDIAIGDVFDKYFAGRAPFGDNESKKHEFPDAFAIQALGQWAEDNDSQMFVVSGDKPFYEACDVWKHLHPKRTIAEVLDHIASEDVKLADFVRSETLKRIVEITAKAKEEFQDRYYWVEDEDGDAQVEITKVELSQPPEIIDIDKEYATLQFTFDATYTAELSYNDSATASYDHEDGTLMYVDRREEEVEGDEKLVVEVEVAYEDLDPDSFEIHSISLVEPSDGFGIQTQRARDWPYK
jgi:hypothetical protein